MRPFRDPRDFQLAVLGSLLLYGTFVLDFDVSKVGFALIVTIGLCTQFLGASYARIPFEARSTLISCFSIALLLRAENPFYLGFAAFLAIGSKFALRWRGKHVFNPTNGAIAALLFWFSPEVWVSPSQWGQTAILAFLMASLGVMVVTRAHRADISLMFLGAYAAIVFGRALWLQDPVTVPLHHLQNGALVLFAFFMISDPKTTPDRRVGRFVFAVAVAALGAYVQFWEYKPRGLFYALFLVSFATPLLDQAWRGARYSWDRPHAGRPLPLANEVPDGKASEGAAGARPGPVRV